MKTKTTKNTKTTTKTSKMSEAALEARRAYKREWARNNPDKVKAAAARHWEKVAREALEG